MAFEADLFTFLDANVAGVSGRVYPMALPQKAVLPALVYRAVSGARSYTIGVGERTWLKPRYQLTVWASTYLAADQVALEVIAALSAYAGPIGSYDLVTGKIVNDIDDREETTGNYRRIVDAILEYEEA